MIIIIFYGVNYNKFWIMYKACVRSQLVVNECINVIAFLIVNKNNEQCFITVIEGIEYYISYKS